MQSPGGGRGFFSRFVFVRAAADCGPGSAMKTIFVAGVWGARLLSPECDAGVRASAGVPAPAPGVAHDGVFIPRC